MAKKNKVRKKGKQKKAGKSMAAKADRYALYLKSVQDPTVDVRFFGRVYKSFFKKAPKALREDFCGTAAVCCEWAKKKKDRKSYGVDIDPEPLAWGRQHNVAKLRPDVQERVQLIEGDVRSATSPRVDIVVAQNFSYCIFRTRDQLRDYFRAALRSFNERGVLILDLFGGYESIEDNREEVTEHSKFDYVWEQAKFDPITHDATFHIHFRFPDGSRLKRAFSYEWRLWTIPEVREVLLEAGYSETHAYWEDTDKKSGEGNGIYRRREHGESDPAWNAYIVGVK